MFSSGLYGFRKSSSVCGRQILKEKQKNYHTTEPRDLFDEHSLLNTPSYQHSDKKHILQRRTVKVVDLTETAKANKNVFIHFTKRLHSWTTIKVSYSYIFGAKSATGAFD